MKLYRVTFQYLAWPPLVAYVVTGGDLNQVEALARVVVEEQRGKRGDIDPGPEAALTSFEVVSTWVAVDADANVYG